MQADNYLIPLLETYLKHYAIYPDRKELQLVLQSSPSFPSALSVIQTCLYFGLKTNGYRADFEALQKNEMPVIAHVRTKDSEKFVLVKQVTERSVWYIDDTGHRMIEDTKENFCASWTGVLILSEKKMMTYRPGENRKSSKYRWAYGLFGSAVLCVILSGFLQHTLSIYTICALLLKSIGIWVCFHLIRHERSFFYSPINRFCHLRPSFDCDKVLRSGGATIFNTISLADIGLVYFISGEITLLLSVFSGLQKDSLLLLFYLSCCCIPYLLFSIIYQRFVIKKWCPLCLGVAGIVLLELSLFICYPDKNIWQTEILPFLYMLMVSFACAVLFLLFYYHLLQTEAEAFVNTTKYLQLKRTPAIFMPIFNRQAYTTVSSPYCIHIGNLDADIMITTLLNPMCDPCKKVAKEIIYLIKKIPENYVWQIRFDGIEANAYEEANRTQLHLLELCRKAKDNQTKLRIMADWFEQQSFHRFLTLHPIRDISTETISTFREQQGENKQLNVKKVPAIWINGRELPLEYAITDIPLLCTDKLFTQLITCIPDKKI